MRHVDVHGNLVAEADALANSVKQHDHVLFEYESELGLLSAVIKLSFEIGNDDLALYYIATAALLGYGAAVDEAKLKAELPEMGDYGGF